MSRRVYLAVAFATVLCSGASWSAVVPVFNTNDNLAGSLRQAIQDASPGDTIVFQIPTTSPGFNANTGIYTISLTSGQLVINKDLTIDAGTLRIVVQRNSASSFLIFNITSGSVRLRNLTIAGGRSAIGDGGNIRNDATLTLNGCTMRDGDSSANFGGGGGLRNHGTSTVINCTIVNNLGAIGGGIFNDPGAILTVRDCTIVGNQGGEGISNGGTAAVRNTIIVGNTRGGLPRDVDGAFVSEGHNLIGNSTTGSGFTATGDQVGATVAQANLGPLQDNGGPTQTMRPLPGSVAIDQGNRGLDGNNQPINIDQRGAPRPVDLPVVPNAIGGDGSDIGAVEVGPAQSGPAFTVTNTTDHEDNDRCTADDCSLREAVAAANSQSDANTINFAAGVGPIIKTTGYVVGSPLTIVGPGARQLTLDGSDAGRLFANLSSNLNISGLTMADGRATDDVGGAISNIGGLTLSNCTIVSCYASGSDQTIGNGGGLYNAAGATATVTGCSFLSNAADNYGGGIYTDGIITITNCTFVSNIALRGGGILSRAAGGASIVTIRNCTIAGNIATDGVAMPGFGGGGLFCEGNAGQHFVGNTILAGNTSTNDPDIRGNYTSSGHNLIGKVGDCVGFTNGVNGDIVGTVGSPVNAQFGAFGNNGGQTNTYTLLGNSPAINTGDNAIAPAKDQRGYGRNGIVDIGAFEFSGTPPPSVPLSSVVSSKVHAGQTFGINLPLTGSPGVECRTGGANGAFTIVLNSANLLTVVGGVSVTSGAATIATGTGINSSDAHQYVIQLTGVVNAQVITLQLANVNDSANNNTPILAVSMGVLAGDTNGDTFVNSGDATQTRNRSGQTADAINFRSDVNADGVVNSGDTTAVRNRSGTVLP